MGIIFNCVYLCGIPPLFLIPLICRKNAALILHDHSQLYTWVGVRVWSSSIIIAYNLGVVYHFIYIHPPIICHDFMERGGIMVHGGAILRISGDEFVWCAVFPLIPHDDHWISSYDLFCFFRNNYSLLYYFDILQFPSFGHFIRCKTSLGVGILVWGR